MLRAQADRLNMPVSQLVRNILSRTVNLVGDISGNLEHMVQGVVGDVAAFKDADELVSRTRTMNRLMESIVGWQTLKLSRATACALTGNLMKLGETGFLGIRRDGRPSVVISRKGLDLIIEHAKNEHPWVPIKLQQTVICVRTGQRLLPGETAYFHPEITPPEFICKEAFEHFKEK